LLDHRQGGQPGLQPDDGGIRKQFLVIPPQVSLGHEGTGRLQGQLELGADGLGLLNGSGEPGPAGAQLLTLLPQLLVIAAGGRAGATAIVHHNITITRQVRNRPLAGPGWRSRRVTIAANGM
jgi:hypothetical protein